MSVQGGFPKAPRGKLPPITAERNRRGGAVVLDSRQQTPTPAPMSLDSQGGASGKVMASPVAPSSAVSSSSSWGPSTQPSDSSTKLMRAGTAKYTRRQARQKFGAARGAPSTEKDGHPAPAAALRRSATSTVFELASTASTPFDVSSRDKEAAVEAKADCNQQAAADGDADAKSSCSELDEEDESLYYDVFMLGSIRWSLYISGLLPWSTLLPKEWTYEVYESRDANEALHVVWRRWLLRWALQIVSWFYPFFIGLSLLWWVVWDLAVTKFKYGVERYASAAALCVPLCMFVVGLDLFYRKQVLQLAVIRVREMFLYYFATQRAMESALTMAQKSSGSAAGDNAASSPMPLKSNVRTMTHSHLATHSHLTAEHTAAARRTQSRPTSARRRDPETLSADSAEPRSKSVDELLEVMTEVETEADDQAEYAYERFVAKTANAHSKYMFMFIVPIWVVINVDRFDALWHGTVTAPHDSADDQTLYDTLGRGYLVYLIFTSWHTLFVPMNVVFGVSFIAHLFYQHMRLILQEVMVIEQTAQKPPNFMRWLSERRADVMESRKELARLMKPFVLAVVLSLVASAIYAVILVIEQGTYPGLLVFAIPIMMYAMMAAFYAIQAKISRLRMILEAKVFRQLTWARPVKGVYELAISRRATRKWVNLKDTNSLTTDNLEEQRLKRGGTTDIALSRVSTRNSLAVTESYASLRLSPGSREQSAWDLHGPGAAPARGAPSVVSLPGMADGDTVGGKESGDPSRDPNASRPAVAAGNTRTVPLARGGSSSPDTNGPSAGGRATASLRKGNLTQLGKRRSLKMVARQIMMQRAATLRMSALSRLFQKGHIKSLRRRRSSLGASGRAAAVAAAAAAEAHRLKERRKAKEAEQRAHHGNGKNTHGPTPYHARLRSHHFDKSMTLTSLATTDSDMSMFPVIPSSEWGVWPVYSVLLKHVSVMVVVGTGLLMLRVVTEFPSCLKPADASNNLERLESDACSPNQRLVLHIFNAIVSYGVTSFSPWVAVHFLSGAASARAQLPYMAVCAVVVAAVTFALDTVWDETIVPAIIWGVVFLFNCVYIPWRACPSSSPADRMVYSKWMLLSALFLVAVRTIQGFFVVPTYVQATTEGERLVTVLVFHPVMTLACVNAAFEFGGRLESVSIVEHATVLLSVPHLLVSMAGRLYLINLDSLKDQINSSVLLTVTEVAGRSIYPLRVYLTWSAFTCNPSAAKEKSEHHRRSALYRNAVYVRMFAEIFSILVAPLFSIFTKWFYDIPLPGATTVVFSLLVQLVSVVAGDLYAVELEEHYLGRSVLSLWRQYQDKLVFLKVFLAMYLVIVGGVARDFVTIVTSTD